MICDAVVKKNFHDISEYLMFFKEYPEDAPDNLFKVVDFLCAHNCQDIVTDLTKAIYKDVCNSKNIIGGDSILDQLIWSYFIPYLKPEYSDDDMVDLSNELKTIEIDQAKCENIHDWRRELFDQTYNILKKESFTAKAFKDFPLPF